MLTKVTVEIVDRDDPDFGEYESKTITELGCGEQAAKQAAVARQTAHAVRDLLAGNPAVFTDGRQFRVRVHRSCPHRPGGCPGGTPSPAALMREYTAHPGSPAGSN